ncbi:hypothetical protein D9757_006469 [Collybiopsis confluens]|uniref:Uncharacterized protein n=1 Tax=Collybiopsis confluens TaxID=2823264 RepID=A0A8H5HJR1_9AGAR|nr:hypothetical protein D9757_006469 [Collybiopsis confluens]
MQPPPASVSNSSSRETVTSQGHSSFGTISTFDGLGSSTGKAIFAFGKHKGVEQLIISRRIASIAAQFPHLDTDNIPNLHSMYMDLLELSRIDMYSHSTRTRALQILMRQIARRCTASLTVALSTWSVVEAKLLISEIVSWFDPTREMEYERAILTFPCPLNSDGRLLSAAAASTYFLQLYVADYEDALYIASDPSTAKLRSFAKSSISAICNSFLIEAFADDGTRGIIESHPIHGLWPQWPMFAFGDTVQNRHHQRREMWKKVGERQIRWRISSIYDTLVIEWPLRRLRRTLVTDPWLPDLMIDLLEFSGSSELPEESDQDSGCSRGFPPLYEALIQILLTSNRTSQSDSFFGPCRQNCLENGCPLELDGVIHFIHRLSQASGNNEDLRRLLVDGGILELLDTTTRRLSSLEALDADDSKYSDQAENQEGVITKGPRYRARILLMASALGHERGAVDSDISISNPREELSQLRISAQYSKLIGSGSASVPLFSRIPHDNWADQWLLDVSVFHTKTKMLYHRDDVYSWMK